MSQFIKLNVGWKMFLSGFLWNVIRKQVVDYVLTFAWSTISFAAIIAKSYQILLSMKYAFLSMICFSYY